MRLIMNKELTIKLYLEDLTPEETLLVSRAKKHAEKALNSKEFWDFCNPYTRGGGTKTITVRTSPWWRFWNKTYEEKEIEVPITGYGFEDNLGLADQEIYQKIMKGAEVLDPTEDHEADIYMKIDRRNKRGVIGYTYPKTNWQWVYSWVLEEFTQEEVAMNIVHEWLHKLGFDHDFFNTPEREHSVPYAVGYFVRDYKGKQ